MRFRGEIARHNDEIGAEASLEENGRHKASGSSQNEHGTDGRQGRDPLSRYLEHVTRLADEKVEEKKTLDHELCRG